MYYMRCYHRADTVVAAGRRSSAAAPGTAVVAGRRGLVSTDQYVNPQKGEGETTHSAPARRGACSCRVPGRSTPARVAPVRHGGPAQSADVLPS